VPYDNSVDVLSDYVRFPTRAGARALQQFVVQVRERDLSVLLNCGALEPLDEFGFALSGSFGDLYDECFGLRIPGVDEGSPALII